MILLLASFSGRQEIFRLTVENTLTILLALFDLHTIWQTDPQYERINLPLAPRISAAPIRENPAKALDCNVQWVPPIRRLLLTKNTTAPNKNISPPKRINFERPDKTLASPVE